MCDYWGRVRVRKASVDDLVRMLTQSLEAHRQTRPRVQNERTGSSDHREFRQVAEEFWRGMGIKDRDRVCQEDEELCLKMRTVEEICIGVVRETRSAH